MSLDERQIIRCISRPRCSLSQSLVDDCSSTAQDAAGGQVSHHEVLRTWTGRVLGVYPEKNEALETWLPRCTLNSHAGLRPWIQVSRADVSPRRSRLGFSHRTQCSVTARDTETKLCNSTRAPLDRVNDGSKYIRLACQALTPHPVFTPRCPQRLPRSSLLPPRVVEDNQLLHSPTRRENAYQASSLPGGSRLCYPVPCCLRCCSGDHRSTIGDNTSPRGTMHPDQLDSGLRCKSTTCPRLDISGADCASDPMPDFCWQRGWLFQSA